MILAKKHRSTFFGIIGFVAALGSAGTADAFDLSAFLKGGSKEPTIIWLEEPPEEGAAPAKAEKPKANEKKEEKVEVAVKKKTGPEFITTIRPPPQAGCPRGRGR